VDKEYRMTVAKSCDVLVVGGGPGGYTTAILAARKGLHTVLVEEDRLGGTCLNRGCVPTKTLLEDSFLVAAVRNCSFMRGDLTLSLRRMLERKTRLVEASRAGIAGVLGDCGVEVIPGRAYFLDQRKMSIQGAENDLTIDAAHVVLATGARTEYGPGLQPDGLRVWSTDDALKPPSVPPTLAVVGAGNRGVEFASLYRNLGTEVILIEQQSRILPRIHPELADRMRKSLADRGVNVQVRTGLTSVAPAGTGGVGLALQTAKGPQELQVDRVLLTGSRHPAREGLNLETIGLSAAECDRLTRDDGVETPVKSVYVVGDAGGPPYLAHKAIAQAMAAVDLILGRNDGGKSLLIPNCIYGDPELASVGLTEDQALSSGHRVKIGEFHFVGNGRAGTLGKEEGLVILVSDASSGKVLGVHMLGPRVTELIALAGLAIQNGLDVNAIKKTVFPHPALSETFFEAALATHNESIHMRMVAEELRPE
jgi:dihydrolipoamide dehydrogenase